MELEIEQEYAAKKPKLTKTEPDRTKSQAVETKIKDLKVKLEKLAHQKTEMVWLLKQVIKADTKRKMQLMKQKKLQLELAKNAKK